LHTGLDFLLGISYKELLIIAKETSEVIESGQR